MLANVGWRSTLILSEVSLLKQIEVTHVTSPLTGVLSVGPHNCDHIM